MFRRLAVTASGIAAAVVMTLGLAQAEGYLVGKTDRVPDLVLTTGEAGFGFEPTEPVRLETGKGYRWWIKSLGKQECGFEAREFFTYVWFRKIEVNKLEIKFSGLHQLEFENPGEVELFFTPIRPGEYTWVCKGLAEKGLTGKIIVK